MRKFYIKTYAIERDFNFLKVYLGGVLIQSGNIIRIDFF